MPRCLFAAVAYLVLVTAARAQSADISLPDRIEGKPGHFIAIKAETKGKIVRWLALDDGLNLFPADLLRDTQTAVVTSTRPGKYRLAAWTSIADVPTRAVICVIEIEGDEPPPPPPPPPGPVDPLTAKLQAAYAADTAPLAAKQQQRTALIGLYQAMTEYAKAGQAATVGDLLTNLQTVGGQLLKADVLVEVRKLIAAEIAAELGSDPAPALDTALQARASALFARIATAVEGVR